MRRVANGDDAIVGAVIRRKRRAANLTMAGLGGAIGCSYQQIQKYETGSNRVAVVTLIRIAAALDTAPVDLMDELVVGLASASTDRAAE